MSLNSTSVIGTLQHKPLVVLSVESLTPPFDGQHHTQRYLWQGTLRVNRYNTYEGWVASESVGQDILISGRVDMNRAFDGDAVAVELLPEEQWTSPAGAVLCTIAVDIRLASMPCPGGARMPGQPVVRWYSDSIVSDGCCYPAERLPSKGQPGATAQQAEEPDAADEGGGHIAEVCQLLSCCIACCRCTVCACNEWALRCNPQ